MGSSIISQTTALNKVMNLSESYWPLMAAVWRGVSPFPFFFEIFLSSLSRAGVRPFPTKGEWFTQIFVFSPGVEWHEWGKVMDSFLAGEENVSSKWPCPDPNPCCLICSILFELGEVSLPFSISADSIWEWFPITVAGLDDTAFITWRGWRGGEIRFAVWFLSTSVSEKLKG